MQDVLILLLLFLIFILFVSMLVGAVMFIVDIWKWSKRPEVFETAEKDLNMSVKEVVHNDE